MLGKNEVLIVFLAFALSVILATITYCSYPGPDSETKSVGDVLPYGSWILRASITAYYITDDPYHYGKAVHSAGSSATGYVVYKDWLTMYMYTENYEDWTYTGGDSISVSYSGLYTRFAKTKAMRTFEDTRLGYFWTASVEADVVASP
ncbi:MAG: hypothetical protein DRN04_12835 [Thermoprotei archaeon]|nr:MAG: hypothetical protein DRN04_12835 [Thermoprotei archaeon]